MTKSFLDALEEWKNDNRYQIEEDIGWEFADDYESGPMPDERSLTTYNGSTTPTKTVFDPRTPS